MYAAREVEMFARVSVYEVPAGRINDATEAVRQAIGQIEEVAGFADAYLLTNAESGRVLTLTLWESLAEMEASRVTASRLRSEAVSPLGGTVVSSEEYKVAFTSSVEAM
jgi:heme-degrading monooxygenase HmoA